LPGEREGEEGEINKDKKNKERTMHPSVNSNLLRGNIVRRRERVLLFIKQGENTPNL